MTNKGDKSKLLNKEKDSFFHGLGMQKNQVIVNQKYFDYVGSKYGQSAKASIIAGKLVVTEVNKSLLKKFNTKDDQKKYLASLEYWEEEEYLAVKDDYQKFSRIIRINLLVAYGNIFTVYRVSLRNRLEEEPKYQSMVEEDGYDVIVLHKLV